MKSCHELNVPKALWTAVAAATAFRPRRPAGDALVRLLPGAGLLALSDGALFPAPAQFGQWSQRPVKVEAA